MPTCTAQMLSEMPRPLKPGLLGRGFHPPSKKPRRQSRPRGFVLAEMVVVVFIVSLFVVLTALSVSRLLGVSAFKTQAYELASVMQKAVTAAAQSDKRYEVILDVAEQTYTLRQITSPDLFEILDEDIIQTGDFTENCWLSYVWFDDSVATDEDYSQARFRAGRSGWQAGGKIVLLDSAGRPYSIVVNRLSRTIELKRGDLELLLPRDKDELPF